MLRTFTDDDFLKLPDRHWALWVSDVEKHAPDLAALLEPFRFIADWRCDGLAVSYAMSPVMVDPGVHEDDLFLWQGQGRCCWQTGMQGADTDTDESAGAFRIDQEWILESGDLLYLPAGLRYRALVLESGFSYAAHFRTLSHRELLSRFLEFVVEGIDPDARDADPDLAVPDHPGEISAAVLNQAQAFLRRALALDDETVAIGFGCALSQPKAGFRAEPEPEPYDEEELREHLRAGGLLQRNPGSRFHYIARLDGEMRLFVDGQAFALGPKVAFMAPLLCQHRVLTPALLRREALKQADARQLLLDLLNEGYLAIYEDD